MLDSPQCSICQSNQAVAFWAQAQDREYFTSADCFKYYVCKSCQVLFLHPLPADRLAEIYPDNYYSYVASKKDFVLEMKQFLDRLFFSKLLAGLANASLSVADIGGGAGTVLTQLKEFEPRIDYTLVIDPSAKSEAAARQSGHDYFCGTIESYAGERKFDLILMLNLIEHVASPPAVMNKLANCLAPGGILILKTPNYKSLDSRIFRHHNWGGYHCPRHWTIFCKPSLISLVESAHLEIQDLSYTQGAPFWTTSVLNALYTAGLIQLSSTRPAHTHPLSSFLLLIFAAFDLIWSKVFPTSQMFAVVRKQLPI